MADDPKVLPRFDTRGLPEGYDPGKLYQYRSEKRSKEATGLEGLIYKFVPLSLIRSFAFAIDPLRDFKVAPGVITPANRTKYLQTASVLQRPSIHFTRKTTSSGSIVNYQGVGGCYGPEVANNPITHTDSTYLGRAQDPLPVIIKDTTRRTRLAGSSQGEFKMFKPSLNAPGRELRSGEESYGFFHNAGSCMATGDYPQIVKGTEYYDMQLGAPAAVFPIYNYNILRALEESYADSLVADNALKMVKKYSPVNREYTLFRNIVELRDVPRSVFQLKDTLSNLRSLYQRMDISPSSRAIRDKVFNIKTALKDIPKEYVSYHFGWKQLYSDTMSLLVQPERQARKLNFLIRRNGKPTTYRASKKFASTVPGLPGFEMDAQGLEQNAESNNRLVRETELRLVINRTFDFPDIDTPKFKHKFMLEQLGIVPRPTDLYNLIPWSWLVDWFTGLGDYVEHMDNINRDTQLINWGMLTAETNGSVYYQFKSTSNFNYNTSIQGVNSNVRVVRPNNYNAQLDYTYQKRVDVAGVLDINATSDVSSLSDYQKSILGALLTQRIKIRK